MSAIILPGRQRIGIQPLITRKIIIRIITKRRDRKDSRVCCGIACAAAEPDEEPAAEIPEGTYEDATGISFVIPEGWKVLRAEETDTFPSLFLSTGGWDSGIYAVCMCLSLLIYFGRRPGNPCPETFFAGRKQFCPCRASV